MGAILVGTSSWSEHAEFYPPGTTPAEQLPFYARRFPVVEVNTTYYAVPRRQVAQGWADRTPASFVFDVKPPRELTGTPATARGEAPEPDADLASTFANAIAPLADAGKLGAVTLQFPPSYRNTAEHREYLRLLPELLPGLPLAVEFRRRDWLDPAHADETLELLHETGLTYTMADEPQVGTGTVPPVYGVTNPRLAIIRFHGRNARNWYRFSGDNRDRFDWDYTTAELAEWTPKLTRAATEAAQVHVLFNTCRDGQGPRNARLLMDQLGLAMPINKPLPAHRGNQNG
jgi:uncharacterized protein YecE (DUF72 family)